jgi:tripartite-type tricarboxylate transporter receptor subunit TctC
MTVMTLTWRIIWLAAAFTVLLFPASSLRADPIGDFYRGKTMHMVIGYGPAGGYDLYGRLAAEFLGRHLPGNPTIVPVNMPGGGSLKALDYLYRVAPQDGTYLGSVSQQLAMNALVNDKITMDVLRFHYVGRLTSNIDVAVTLPRTGITSFDDLRKREVVVGADQSGSMSVVYAHALNAYAGAKLKVVKGYSGSAEVQLAAERGEVEVNGSYSLPAVLVAHPDWVKGKGATILYQNALKRFARLPQVPTISELMLGDQGRAIARVIAGTAEVGRSILTTPGVPPERLAALRAAFQAMLKDPEFLDAVSKRKLLLDADSGEAMDAINQDTMNLPKPTVAALRKLLKE